MFKRLLGCACSLFLLGNFISGHAYEQHASLASLPVLLSAEASIGGGQKAAVHQITTHPGICYFPVMITSYGSTVELNDGSSWVVSPEDSYKVLNWFYTDAVVITPNQDWFSPYAYCLNNQTTMVAVRVNLTAGSVYYGPYTHWITCIDTFNDLIYLEDGSVWGMKDYPVFKKWAVNDRVLIGLNSGWYASREPNILLNVNTGDYACCKCFQY